MADILIDYSQIQLQENIPLSEEEIKNFEEERKKLAKLIPTVLGISTFIVIVFCGFIKGFSTFKFYEYMLFAAAGFALFLFTYLISFLVTGYDSHNWKKDKIHGKNRLISIIINRDKTEYGEYLSFAGKSKNDIIRLEVELEIYSRYQIGTRVEIEYLKHGKKVLSIHEL
ncbi:hypothetical protein ACQWU4_07275 [Chryseobacterium sp. MIQD13]|uniref:hypothetical protein n=1 Tax=Chryseobacterium sp. MIQD13 TaxID=3422310 RepID=UPI003D2855E1